MTSYLNEIFADVDGYNGKYRISNYGRVLSTQRRIFLKPQGDTESGFVVTLWYEGVREVRTIHSLVVEHFSHDYIPGTYIRHLDSDKSNNHISNLEPIGPYNRIPNGEYGPEDVVRGRPVYVVEWDEVYGNALVLASMLDTAPRNIYKVLNGERIRHLGLTFEYAD